MKFGVNAFIWSAEFGRAQLPLLPKIKAWGFDGIEVPIFRPNEFAAQRYARVSKRTILNAPSARFW